MSAYSFTDTLGVEREISINFYTIFKVYSATGYDLLNPDKDQGDGTLSTKLLEEPLTVLKAYADFFVPLGREWIAIAIRQSLEARAEGNEAARVALLGSEQKNYSSSSSPQSAKTTGKPKRSGNSQDSPTQTSEKNLQTEPISSPQSTTRTSRASKTSDSRETSTPTKKQKAEPKRKNS